MAIDDELLDKMREAALNGLDPVTREFVEMTNGNELSYIMKQQNEMIKSMVEEAQTNYLASIKKIHDKIVEADKNKDYQSFAEWAAQYTFDTANIEKLMDSNTMRVNSYQRAVPTEQGGEIPPCGKKSLMCFPNAR